MEIEKKKPPIPEELCKFARDSDEMKKYKVRVYTSAIEFWEVEAENEQEAMENYWEGENYLTKPKSEHIEMMEE